MFDDATCLYSPGTSYADATTLVMDRVSSIADAVTRVVPRLRAAMRSETDTRAQRSLGDDRRRLGLRAPAGRHGRGDGEP